VADIPVIANVPGVRSVPSTIATFDAGDFDPAELVAAKADQTVSVCLPARNEAPTVGAIVRSIREALVDRHPLVDEIVVVDDHSTDDTADVALAAGAKVVAAADVLAEYGKGHGKGAALWKSLAESTGDLVVWCDADLVDFDPRFVTGLVGPLLARRDIDFVKGFYDRPSAEAGGRGGRVTELVARPLLAVLFPHLSPIVQPLAGEYAGRRELLEQLPFVDGYGVDIALLIDIADEVGVDAIAQVDLGTRVHRNRSLDELSPQAVAVIQTALNRAGHRTATVATLHRPGLDTVEVELLERPPLASLAGRSPVRRGA